MSLKHDGVSRIAQLAKIDVPAAQAAEVLGQLNRVLALIDELQAVCTAGVAPMAHALDGRDGDSSPIAQRLRADAVTEGDRREDFQALAPAAAGGLYLVPRVIE